MKEIGCYAKEKKEKRKTWHSLGIMKQTTTHSRICKVDYLRISSHHDNWKVNARPKTGIIKLRSD